MKKLKTAVRLIDKTLPLWGNFAEKNLLTYRDSITGLRHTVRKELIADTLNAAQKPDRRETVLKLLQEYEDPMVALQDGDWNPPDPAVKILYSAMNLLRAVSGDDTPDDESETMNLSINQAIDALENSGTLGETDIKKILHGETPA